MAKLSVSKAWEESTTFLGRRSRLVTPVALAMFMIPGTLFAWYNRPAIQQGERGPRLAPDHVRPDPRGCRAMAIAGLAVGWSGSVGAALSKRQGVWGVLAAVLLIFAPLTVVLVFAIAIMIGGSGHHGSDQITAEALAAVPGPSFLLLAMTLVFLFAAVRLFPLSVVGMVETANPLRLLRAAGS
jgi:hypothetical protein